MATEVCFYSIELFPAETDIELTDRCWEKLQTNRGRCSTQFKY